MKTIEIELDEETFARAQRAAQARHCSLQGLLRDFLEQVAPAGPAIDPFAGMFADEPELIDQILESAMRSREEQPLRRTSE